LWPRAVPVLGTCAVLKSHGSLRLMLGQPQGEKPLRTLPPPEAAPLVRVGILLAVPTGTSADGTVTCKVMWLARQMPLIQVTHAMATTSRMDAAATATCLLEPRKRRASRRQ